MSGNVFSSTKAEVSPPLFLSSQANQYIAPYQSKLIKTLPTDPLDIKDTHLNRHYHSSCSPYLNIILTKQPKQDLKMLFSTLIYSAALPLLTLASPLKTRAGGPGFTPIPANCTIINPLPHASQHYGNGTITGWVPSDAAMNNTAYQFYLTQPDFVTYATRYEQCLEQCNSLAGCKSVVFANNAPTPKGYFGTAGGVPSVGCVMFKQYLTPEDFVPATANAWVNETSANIYC